MLNQLNILHFYRSIAETDSFLSTISFILSPWVAQAALMHHRRASEVLSVPSIFLTRSTFSASSSVSFAALMTVTFAAVLAPLGCCCDFPSNEIKFNHLILIFTGIKRHWCQILHLLTISNALNAVNMFLSRAWKSIWSGFMVISSVHYVTRFSVFKG